MSEHGLGDWGVLLGVMYVRPMQGGVQIECNYCSQGDYVFQKDRYAVTIGSEVLRSVTDHMATYHPEKISVTPAEEERAIKSIKETIEEVTHGR